MSDVLVYLMQGGPYYKIGRTKNLMRRVKDIQTGHPYPLVVVHTWQVDNGAALEGYLHRKYASCKMNGEWFQLSIVDIETMIAVKEWVIEPPTRVIKPRRHGKPEHPLTRWRKVHGVTQQALADASGLTQGMIAHIENYRHIPVRESLERLRAFTGLPTDALVRGERFLVEQPDFAYSHHLPNPCSQTRRPNNRAAEEP